MLTTIDLHVLGSVCGGDGEDAGGSVADVCTERNPTGAPGMGSPHEFRNGASSLLSPEQQTWKSVHDHTQPVYEGVERFNKLNRPAGPLFGGRR